MSEFNRKSDKPDIVSICNLFSSKFINKFKCKVNIPV